MGKTAIEWTEETWNPIVGCSVVSPGCTNCYAMKTANRLANIPTTPQYRGTIQQSRGGPVWTGKVALAEKSLAAPLKRRKPTMYFVNSMGDLFHENVPDEWIDRVFAVMALCPQHTFQVLTKRADRMREYLTRASIWDWWARASISIAASPCAAGAVEDCTWPLPNVWLGVSAEDQTRADERIPALLATPAEIRFVSFEPLLGPVDSTNISPNGIQEIDSLRGRSTEPDWVIQEAIDWVIVGGESGPNARPMHPDWPLDLLKQCQAASVPFFFKQWGEWAPVHIDQDEDGHLDAAYPMVGCGNPDAHRCDQECLFWQGDQLVHWPKIEHLPAIGARRVGKKAAGRLLAGREWKEMPG